MKFDLRDAWRALTRDRMAALAGGAACYVPARRAARVDPLSTLKT